MADEYTGKASFLHGLSDLWLRFFEDKDSLKAIYRGTEILIGQAYLDLVSNVLNTSMREVPVFNKEFFKLLTVREDNIAYDAALNKYVFEMPDNLKNFTYLYNKIFAQTAMLEKDLDFTIDISGETDDLQFNDDPFNWQGSGNPPQGFAYRTVEVLQSDGSIADKREIAFWIPDAEQDQFNMYLTFGYLLNRFEPSSEAYRALLQGITRYFVLGPAFDHIESALNVFVGFPLIRDDGEILQEVDTTTDADYSIVKTDRDDYYIPVDIPLKAAITNTSNWGTLVLHAFEVLTAVFTVKDVISDPTWWHDITIPDELIPDEPLARRVITSSLYDNLINNPDGLVKIGDPGFIIGADEDGFVPTGRPGQRHLFSYIAFERFLRHHIYTVVFDRITFQTGELPYARSRTALEEIIVAGASAYTYLFFEPDFVFEDGLLLSEEAVGLGIRLANTMQVMDNSLNIGNKSWKIGETFQYTSVPPDMDIGSGKITPIVIGGSDPYHLSLMLEDDESGAYLANVTWTGSCFQAVISGKDVFDASDVGRYMTFSSDTGYRKIIQVIDARTVYLDGGTAAAGDTWSLWESTNEDVEERIGVVDWPIQVKTIP